MVTKSTDERLKAAKREGESFTEVIEHGHKLVTRDLDFSDIAGVFGPRIEKD